MITFIGSTCLDINLVIDDFKKEVSRVKEEYVNPGGNALNAAVTSAALGTPTNLITQLGSDKDGQYILAALKKQPNLKISYKTIARTPKARALIYPGGRKFVVDDYPAEGFDPDQNIKEIIRTAKIVDFYPGFLGSYLDEFYSLATGLKAISLKHLSEEIDSGRKYDILIESEEVVDAPTNKELELIGAKIAILTSGRKGGRYWLEGQGWQKYSPVKTKEIDNIGAGDGFRGGFLVGLSRGYSFSEAIDLAAKSGAALANNKGSFLNDSLDF